MFFISFMFDSLYSFCFLILIACVVFPFVFAVERMLPLTGAQSKKYLEEVEKNKNLDGYVSSDPVGLKLRKLKRKEPPAKNDTRAGEMEVEDLEGAGDAAAFVDSPCRLL